jgi:ABC-2 type transport system permease protein
MANLKKSLYTVRIFTKLNTRRFFRDKLAIFFVIIFPVIFLFVFGGIFGRDSDTSFKIALINQSDTQYSKQFVNQLKNQKIFKVDSEATTINAAKEKMNRSQLDATVVLPPTFGAIKAQTPSGQAKVLYTQNNQQAGQALESILQAQFQQINGQFVNTQMPFTVKAEQLSNKSLSQFDYVFSGLLGFSIVGLGIFGPVNVFPELKKQGILRRLSTTPLKVWQYFTSTAISQAIVGLLAMAVMFAIAITVFHLEVAGNWIGIAIFLALSIITILGIGLAVGGWAKNERQAAPLANLVVFPMLFLSGTFFPRFLMPDWLQKVSNYLPLTPVIDGIRLMATEGKSLFEIGPQVGLLLVWLVVIYAIAFRVFRWE